MAYIYREREKPKQRTDRENRVTGFQTYRERKSETDRERERQR